MYIWKCICFEHTCIYSTYVYRYIRMYIWIRVYTCMFETYTFTHVYLSLHIHSLWYIYVDVYVWVNAWISIARTCTHRQTWRSACTDISVGELGSPDQRNKQSNCAGSIQHIHARKPSNTGLFQPILTTPGSQTGLCYMFIQFSSF